jgi:MYXO-CTERM domain-containing protein
MNWKQVFAVAAVCVVALGSVGPANATVILSENWSGASTTNPRDLGSDNYSQLGPGTYYIPSDLPGWTESGQVGGWATSPSTTISGVLLNEGSYGATEGSISLTTLVNGLQAGGQYKLSFDYWGDNRPGSVYQFDYAIDGGGAHVTDSWVTVDTGTFNTIDYVFTASASSAALSFTASTVSPSQASPIIGSVTVSSVPEPATLAIWSVLGGLGLLVSRRRRRKAA